MELTSSVFPRIITRLFDNEIIKHPLEIIHTIILHDANLSVSKITSVKVAYNVYKNEMKFVLSTFKLFSNTCKKEKTFWNGKWN